MANKYAIVAGTMSSQDSEPITGYYVNIDGFNTVNKTMQIKTVTEGIPSVAEPKYREAYFAFTKKEAKAFNKKYLDGAGLIVPYSDEL